MSFEPYLYFSFVFISIFSILEVTKNFKHSVLLKVQFIGLLTFASIVNLFLFKGQLSDIELSIVRLLIDLMPIFVFNIALILYIYKVIYFLAGNAANNFFKNSSIESPSIHLTTTTKSFTSST